jgi:hypothetical protein
LNAERRPPEKEELKNEKRESKNEEKTKQLTRRIPVGAAFSKTTITTESNQQVCSTLLR